MSVLAKLVGSRIRAEILRLLFSGREEELHVREIERRTGFNDRAIRLELANLVSLDLIVPRRDGNRLQYAARRDHPLYVDLHRITLKTAGLADVLRDALKSKKISVAFVFGSVARGVEKAASDVDLMVLGRLTLRELTGLLSGISERLGREINPHVMTPEEFRRKVAAGDHFVRRVIEEPRILIIGNERDVEELAR
jgi:predicted nucleotidyltransferase